MKGKIFCLSDILCNAGDVTTSLFEGVQNDMNFY